MLRGGRRRASGGRRKAAGASTALSVFLLLSSVFLGCGKKAPPLAPLNMAPEAPKTVTARRLGDSVYLEIAVPDHSVSGTGPFSVDHLDVFAVTIAPGTPAPPNRDLLKPEHVVAKIPVRPPPDPDAPEPATPDTRPLPGEVATFVEKVTEAVLTPQVITKPEPPPKTTKTKKGPAKTAVAPPTAAGAAATPPAPVGPLVLTRLYVVQGVPKNGKAAIASARVEVPLLQAPAPPRPAEPTADETSVTLSWEPPPSTSDEAPGVLYNVYSVPAAGAPPPAATATPLAPTPLNDKPLAEQTFSHAGAAPGKEQCFVVRSVATVGTAAIESDPTPPICITPTDTFPPAAPKALAAVASTGVINLIWDANAEADLAGYLILRGEAPGDRLQALMEEPIKETRYADRTARPGVRYVYQIVAVDKAGNRSALSNRVEEAAR